MADADAVLSRYGVATSTVCAQARGHLDTVLDALDADDYRAFTDALIEIWPVLLEDYGAANASMAASVYALLRGLAGVDGRYFPVEAAAPSLEVVEDRVRWAMSTAWKTRDLDKAKNNLRGVLVEQVQDMARETIAANAVADRRENGTIVGWGIRADEECCDYCRVKDTRGKGPYKSMNTAKRTFHKHCECDVVPVFGSKGR